MELLTAIQNALSLKPRQGWVCFLTGLTPLMLIHWKVVSPDAFDGTIYAALVILTVLGASILIVSLGALFAVNMQTHISTSRSNKELQLQKERRDQEALLTAKILTGYDARALVDLISAGQQRFVKSRDTYGLWSKGIILDVPGQSDTYMVTDSVWIEREAIKTLLFPKMAQFPKDVNY